MPLCETCYRSPRCRPRVTGALCVKVGLVYLLLEDLRESRFLQVAQTILQNRQCLGNEDSAAQQGGSFHPLGDQFPLSASAAEGFSCESGSQVSEIIQNTEYGGCNGSTAIECHEMMESGRAGGADIVWPSNALMTLGETHSFGAVHLACVNSADSTRLHDDVAHECRIAHMPDTCHACVSQPAAYNLHAWSRTKPDIKSSNTRLPKDIGDARHPIGGQSLLGSTQMNSVEVRGGIRALFGQRDADVGRAERRDERRAAGAPLSARDGEARLEARRSEIFARGDFSALR